MPYITREQLAEYNRLRKERNSGKNLTPDGLRFICEACNYDAEQIGKHFLSILPGLWQENELEKLAQVMNSNK